MSMNVDDDPNQMVMPMSDLDMGFDPDTLSRPSIPYTHIGPVNYLAVGRKECAYCHRVFKSRNTLFLHLRSEGVDTRPPVKYQNYRAVRGSVRKRLHRAIHKPVLNKQRKVKNKRYLLEKLVIRLQNLELSENILPPLNMQMDD